MTMRPYGINFSRLTVIMVDSADGITHMLFGNALRAVAIDVVRADKFRSAVAPTGKHDDVAHRSFSGHVEADDIAGFGVGQRGSRPLRVSAEIAG